MDSNRTESRPFPGGTQPLRTVAPSLTHRRTFRTRSVIGIAWLVAAATSLGSLPADALQQIQEIGYSLHRLGPLGVQGWGAVDADGDGRHDLVTTADGPAALILVYGRVAGSSQLRLKQSLVRPPDSIAALATVAGGDPASVVVVGSDRVATLYGGWPLAAISSFVIEQEATRVRVADVDADGQLELVCIGANALGAYALPAGELKWSRPIAAVDLALAQLDDDPALELVLARGDSTAGIILDGATAQPEWSWPGGFGSHVAAGRFGYALEPGFVTATDFGSVSGFWAAPYASAWTMNNFDTDGVAAGDTDADGRAEFAVGDGQWGSVRIYDGANRQMLYEFANQGHGLWGLDFVDFDGDARSEVWYSSRIENSSNRDDSFAAAIMNPINALPRFVINSYWQGAGATTLADVDGDGRQEWLIGTTSNSSSRGLLRALDAATQVEEWRAPYVNGGSNQHYQMVYRSLQVAHYEGDPIPRLIAVGGSNYAGFRFMVINGASKQVEAQIPGQYSPWGGEIVASRLVQQVPGGNPELLVLSHSTGNRLPSIQLFAFSLPSGEMVWSAPRTGGEYDHSLSLDVGQLDEDPATEYLVAHTAGVAAFDSATGATEWTLPLTVRGALIVPDTQGPTVHAYAENGTVSVYAASTRELIREFSLPAPLEKLATLPGDDERLLAIAGERLVLLRLADGQLLAESDWIGSQPEAGDNLSVVREGNRWRVSTGRAFAAYLHWVPDPDVYFENGFE